jgi:hypothetical protein
MRALRPWARGLPFAQSGTREDSLPTTCEVTSKGEIAEGRRPGRGACVCG